MRDGRLTNSELAARINLSASACLRRVKIMEDAGLIAGYVMLLDPVLAGIRGVAFVLVTLDQQGRAALDRFEAAATRFPEVLDETFQHYSDIYRPRSPVWDCSVEILENLKT